MIELNQDLFIAKGMQRSTYHHPSDDSLCIKVNHGTDLSKRRQKREIIFYKKLKKKGVPFNNIAEFVGVTDTSIGDGHIYKKVIDYDGSISTDLYQVLLSLERKDEDLFKKIRELGEFLKSNNIFFHDNLLRGNILCRKNEDFSYDLIIVDALGDTILIPILNYIPAHARARIIRKWYRHLVSPAIKEFSWITVDDLKI